MQIVQSQPHTPTCTSKADHERALVFAARVDHAPIDALSALLNLHGNDSGV